MNRTSTRNAGGRLIGRMGRLAAVILTGASILALSAGPANAEGGGCRTWSNNSFSFAACIGDDGKYAYGDTYINRFTGSNCRVTIQVTNGQTASYACRTGHLGPVVAVMSRGVNYYTNVTVTSSAGQLVGSSPRAWKL
ncbi:hypothetical protein Aple_056810 [Acrocarpospora pleiomorpha]|uniref:Ig-like domain-containing protein n=1 Tax=Acrocarpospora pleiomorpha TaxID=90975 RepID=A0A5M3XP89_9ACTN|nr:hypothetical protein Aple_056810 [Acrocarpospora pleiomorpha]